MKLSLSCCGHFCCAASQALSKEKSDARIPQSEVAAVYDRLSGIRYRTEEVRAANDLPSEIIVAHT